MLPSDDLSGLAGKELPLDFAENRGKPPSLDAIELEALKALDLVQVDAVQVMLPPPVDGRVPRIVLADDLERLHEELSTSAMGQAQALDFRSWLPQRDVPLNEWLTQQVREQWWPDLLVLDINLDDGGFSGQEYLERVRQEPGLLALPVVLATGGSLADSLKIGEDLANPPPGSARKWLLDARRWEPEAVLFGKQGDRTFLRRLLENLPVWREAARRRAWNVLLEKVAVQLDAVTPSPNEVAATIAEFAHAELGMSEVFVRWRTPNGRFGLIGRYAEWDRRPEGDELEPESIPFLVPLMEDYKAPVVNNTGLTKDEAGILRGHLAGRKGMAAAAVIGKRSIGFISMFKTQSRRDFDDHIDVKPLALLARLLASALGRAETLRVNRERDHQLLTFADNMSTATDEQSVCQELAQLVHDTLHAGDDQNGEVVIRLARWDTGELERPGHVGLETLADPIYLWTPKSMMARVILKKVAERCPDMHSDEWQSRCLDTSVPGGQLHSEVCVPLLSGAGAIGALNAEHTQLDRYRQDDLEFMKASAALASAALERIRVTKFVDDILDFASSFDRKTPNELTESLIKILQGFSGASAIVRLEAPQSGALVEPWIVHDASVFMHGGNPTVLENSLRSAFEKFWDRTTFRRWIVESAWRTSKFSFEHNPGNPVAFGSSDALDMSPEGLPWDQPMGVVWHIRPGEDRPYAVELLIWFITAPITDRDKALFVHVAELLTALEASSHQVRTWQRTVLEREQAAVAGMEQQHIRHRMQSDVASLKGLVDLLALHVDRTAMPAASVLVDRLNERITLLGSSFKKANSYVKAPDIAKFSVRRGNSVALKSLEDRLKDVEVVDQTSIDSLCWGDFDIYCVSLFALLDNSLVAMKGKETKRLQIEGPTPTGDGLAIRVVDNGPGVLPGMLEKLFVFGATSKPDGLGSALAFARMRMRLFGGDVRFVTSSETGATFELLLPVSEENARRALSLASKGT